MRQLSDEWFAARVGKVTGSRVGAILGFNQYQSADDVLREMVREAFGAEKEFTGNIATQWGQDHESEALKWYEQQTGNLVLSTGFWTHPEHEWLGASPDGFVEDDTLVEVKCPYNKELFNPAGRKDYMAQVQLQMHVTGRTTCEFVVWTPGFAEVATIRIDPSFLDRHLEELKAFYARYLEIINDKELAKPYLEDLVVERDDQEWVSAAEQYRHAQAVFAAAKHELDLAKETLVKAAGGKKTRGEGVLVYPVKGRNTVDYKSIVKDHKVDVSKYSKTGKPSWSVKVI